MPYLRALEVCSRRGAIQIHVNLYITCGPFTQPILVWPFLYAKVYGLSLPIRPFQGPLHRDGALLPSCPPGGGSGWSAPALFRCCFETPSTRFEPQTPLSIIITCTKEVMPDPAFVCSCIYLSVFQLAAPCGDGAPLFPLVHLLPHLFPFSLFPFFPWLYPFSSFVHPFPFYQNSPTPFPGRRS